MIPNDNEISYTPTHCRPVNDERMGWQPPPVTVCRMDATSERTWTYLQRVTGGGCQFMSRMGLMRVNPDAVGFKANDGNFNGTAVTPTL